MGNGVHSNVPFIKYVKQHAKTNNPKENKTKYNKNENIN